MKATISSRILRLRRTKGIIKEVTLKDRIFLLSKPKMRWPAVMLAIKRIANVKGRIRELNNSIRTIKFISPQGVPKGTRWAREFLGLRLRPILYPANHSGRPRLRD